MSLKPIGESLKQVGRQARRVHRDDLDIADLWKCHDDWWLNPRNRAHVEHVVAVVKSTLNGRAAVSADRAKHIADLLLKWTSTTDLEAQISRKRLAEHSMMTAGQVEAALKVLTEAGILETTKKAQKHVPGRRNGWAARRRLRYLLKARPRHELAAEASRQITTEFTDADADRALAPDADDLEAPPPVDRACHTEPSHRSSPWNDHSSPWNGTQFTVEPPPVDRADHTPLPRLREELETANSHGDDRLGSASPNGAGDAPASYDLAIIDAEISDALEQSRAEPW